tara:strand:- start:207 stop:608 length:402 start_codon:yes stop_codon:yes gene_type:complete
MIGWFEAHKKVSLIITGIIAAAIFYISSLQFGGSGAAGGSNFFAIVYHICAFFFLALFLGISFVRGRYKSFFPAIIFLSVLYGVSDEIHQFFVPGRSMAFGDVLLDSVGIVFAMLIYRIRVEYKIRSRKFVNK